MFFKGPLKKAKEKGDGTFQILESRELGVDEESSGSVDHLFFLSWLCAAGDSQNGRSQEQLVYLERHHEWLSGFHRKAESSSPRKRCGEVFQGIWTHQRY